MECTVRWVREGGMTLMAETGSGHVLMIDGAPDGGGRNLAPRPMETVLAGTGGCTAYDVVTILKRGRHDVRGCTVKLEAERATTDPSESSPRRFAAVSGRSYTARSWNATSLGPSAAGAGTCLNASSFGSAFARGSPFALQPTWPNTSGSAARSAMALPRDWAPTRRAAMSRLVIA